MKRSTKILIWSLAGMATLFVAGILAFGQDFEDSVQALKKAAAEVRQPAVHFDPECPPERPSCEAWARFRQAHPYPYQSFAAAPLKDGTVALVLSEPAPSVDEEILQQLIEAAFGDELLDLTKRRWWIGLDGWLEDIVLEVRQPAPTLQVGVPPTGSVEDEIGALLEDDLFSDRLALLHFALYGTTFGGDLERIGAVGESLPRPDSTNLKVTSRELREWVLDSSLKWHPIGHDSTESRTWKELSEDAHSGAFSATDHSLVLFTFPTSLGAEAQADIGSVDRLRAEFRRFAVASDLVLGALWYPDGQAAIIARPRVTGATALPPLRFETFALLASQRANELHQSYERNSLFAGKLTTGPYSLRDWAPIFLSPALINSELGALLNITDQMLKSWSEAGHIEYLFFDYPLKPNEFAFGEKPLSDHLHEESGATSVLFNWNTSGSAAAVDFGDIVVLSATQTGALPVTYGSSLEDDEMETGHLVEREKRAYDYFADLSDPNLTRVVQYTLIYQMFRAIAANSGQPLTMPSKAADPRRESTEFLTAEIEKLLGGLKRGDEIRELISDLATRYPKMTKSRLARILAEPRSGQPDLQTTLETGEELEKLRLRYNALVDELEFDIDNLNLDIDSYNRLVETRSSSLALESGRLRIETKKRAIRANERLAEEWQQRLEQGRIEMEGPWAALELAGKIGPTLKEQLTRRGWDLETVLKGFVAHNDKKPVGAIKTPSVVLSWDREGVLMSVGGHNLDSRSLRFEPSIDVNGVELVKTKSGPVLRYHPSQASGVAEHAARIARNVEFGGVRDAAKLTDMAREPIRTRSRRAALELPPKHQGPGAWIGRLGLPGAGGEQAMVRDLRTLAETNTCCVFVGQSPRDAFIVRQNLKPPPAVQLTQVRGSAGLRDRLSMLSKQTDKPIVFLGQSRARIEALVSGLSVPSAPNKLMALARSLGLKHKGDAGSAFYTDPARPGRISEWRAYNKSTMLQVRQSLFRLMGDQTRRAARVDDVPPDVLAKILKNAGWNPNLHGRESALAVAFDSRNSKDAITVDLVAGFAGPKSSQGKPQLARAIELERRMDKEPLEFVADVEERLRKAEEPKLRRFLSVIRDGETIVAVLIFEHADLELS